MPSRTIHLPFSTARACWLSGAGLVLATGLAAAEPLESLREHSPFLPPGSSATTPADAPAIPVAAPSSLQLQGIYQLNGRGYFLIFDTTRRETTWARENDPESPYKIVAFDPDQNEVTLQIAGALQRLKLEGRLPPMAAATAAPPPPPRVAAPARPPTNVPTGLAYPSVTPPRPEYIPGTDKLRYLPDSVLEGLSEPEKAAIRRQYMIDLVEQGHLPDTTPLPPEYGQHPDAADTVAAIRAREAEFRRTTSTYRDDDERRAREAAANGQADAPLEP